MSIEILTDDAWLIFRTAKILENTIPFLEHCKQSTITKTTALQLLTLLNKIVHLKLVQVLNSFFDRCNIMWYYYYDQSYSHSPSQCYLRNQYCQREEFQFWIMRAWWKTIHFLDLKNWNNEWMNWFIDHRRAFQRRQSPKQCGLSVMIQFSLDLVKVLLELYRTWHFLNLSIITMVSLLWCVTFFSFVQNGFWWVCL
jgi:hypothetical protein